MTVNLPNLGPSAGTPSQWTDTINPVLEGLIVGETPAVVTQDMQLAASQTLEAFTPVGFDDSGNLVAALTGSADPADDIKAIGITLYKIVVPAATNPGVPILRSGCLAKHMLAWPASFDTDAEKFNAFAGAPTPTNIVVREVYFGSTVAAP
ncbi:head decoration protein [Mesorhizobium sp. B2-1-2]|uniref:head decoration protein n=1 Tax=Mesorhizobium sp. B2-1-2 TaxID=2589973 RepID=UPI00112C463D|nr:head decoration protein [Mesorhizobium sp. B2-1-2]TPN04550.1 head decoration protein [Mesorhizobium sp. B2-1-2]